ncbi:hypothetical protein HDU97_008729, partial [Phlyctochytrium planicorne]
MQDQTSVTPTLTPRRHPDPYSTPPPHTRTLFPPSFSNQGLQTPSTEPSSTPEDANFQRFFPTWRRGVDQATLLRWLGYSLNNQQQQQQQQPHAGGARSSNSAAAAATAMRMPVSEATNVGDGHGMNGI